MKERQRSGQTGIKNSTTADRGEKGKEVAQKQQEPIPF